MSRLEQNLNTTLFLRSSEGQADGNKEILSGRWKAPSTPSAGEV
ncbi:MAG: hypothetical protein ACLVLH_14270 [Eisenbergiella massiliensis]